MFITHIQGAYVHVLKVPSTFTIMQRKWHLRCTCVKWGTNISADILTCSVECDKAAFCLLTCLLYTLTVSLRRLRPQLLAAMLNGHCVSILMYADDILLLAPTVSALQRLLNVCQCELQYLDINQSINQSVLFQATRPIHEKQRKEKTHKHTGGLLTYWLLLTDMVISDKKSVCTRFGRVINNRVVIYLLRMVVRLSGVRMLDILVFILCHLSHFRVLLVIPNGHSIGHSMQLLV